MSTLVVSSLESPVIEAILEFNSREHSHLLPLRVLGSRKVDFGTNTSIAFDRRRLQSVLCDFLIDGKSFNVGIVSLKRLLCALAGVIMSFWWLF